MDMPIDPFPDAWVDPDAAHREQHSITKRWRACCHRCTWRSDEFETSAEVDAAVETHFDRDHGGGFAVLDPKTVG